MKIRSALTIGCLLVAIMGVGGVGVSWAPEVWAAGLKGKYEKLKEPSTHTRGKVKLAEFADFYCPHCHMFEQTAIPLLEKEFGHKVEVTMVGFPVIRGMLPTPFLMYEQAKIMGKGPEMKKVLFRSIHQQRITIMDRTIRALLVKEVGLDPVAFEAGLASGQPAKAFEDGKKWGERIKVSSTPTVLLDGNIKIEGEGMTADNLKTVIRSILAGESRR